MSFCLLSGRLVEPGWMDNRQAGMTVHIEPENMWMTDPCGRSLCFLVRRFGEQFNRDIRQSRYSDGIELSHRSHFYMGKNVGGLKNPAQGL